MRGGSLQWGRQAGFGHVKDRPQWQGGVAHLGVHLPRGRLGRRSSTGGMRGLRCQRTVARAQCTIRREGAE
eukprot:10740044-Heterocapsa_arctica.AAC.1